MSKHQNILLLWHIGWMALFLPCTAFPQDQPGSMISVIRVKLIPNAYWDSMFVQNSTEVSVYRKIRSADETPELYAQKVLEPGERTATFVFAKDNDSVVVVVISSIQLRITPSLVKSVGKDDYIEAVLKSGDTVTIGGIFPRPCRYDFTIRHKTCPRCGRTDRVRVLFVGSEVYDPGKKDDSFSKIGYWDPFIEPADCNPNWYCLRDKIAF